jgi:hypothetical protein
MLFKLCLGEEVHLLDGDLEFIRLSVKTLENMLGNVVFVVELGDLFFLIVDEILEIVVIKSVHFFEKLVFFLVLTLNLMNSRSPSRR